MIFKEETLSVKKHKEFSKKFADYYQTENQEESFTLVSIKDYLYPFYRVGLECSYRQKIKISIGEEYFLKGIQVGISNGDDLQKFLGLDLDTFESLYAELHHKNYFQRLPTLSLSPEGEELLEKQEREILTREHVKVYIDGITGTPQLKDVHTSHSKVRLPKLVPGIYYPRPENLQQHFYRPLFEVIEKASSRGNSSNSEENEMVLHEILEMEGKARKIDQKRTVLFYQNSSNSEDWKILVLVGGEPDEKASHSILDQEQKGKKILDFPKKDKDKETQDSTLQKEIEILRTTAEVDKLQDGDIVTTYSHPIILEKALKEATDSIYINAPWITHDVIDHKFKDMLKEALEREVKIRILFGMEAQRGGGQRGGGQRGGGQRKSKPDIDSDSETFFNELHKKYKDSFRFYKMEGNHGKVLICDEHFMVTTSFNWLSFKGDPNRAIRHEFGSFSRNAEQIKKVKDHFSSFTKNV